MTNHSTAFDGPTLESEQRPSSPVVQTFCTTLLIVGCGLLGGVLLARGLGPQGRGEVAAALLWPGLLVPVAGLGIPQALVVFTACDESLTESLLSTATCLGFFFSLLAMAAGALLLPILLHSQTAEVVRAGRIFLLAIPAAVSSGFAIAVLQGRSKFGELNFVRVVTPGGYVLGMAALLLLHQLTVTNVVYLQLSLAYITLLVAVLMLWKNDVHLTPAACDPAIAEKLLAFGGKAYVGGITGIFHQRLDQVLLAAFFPAAELGLYSVAVSSSSAIDTIGFAFRTVAAPQIAQHAKIPDKFRELRQTFTKFAVTAGSGAALLALVFPILIPFVYGRPFRGSVTCAELLLLAQLLYTTKSLLTSAAEAFGDSWLGSKAELLGFVPTTVFLVSLLPKFGIVGAALAVLGGCSIQLSVMMAGFSRMKKSFAGARLSARQGK